MLFVVNENDCDLCFREITLNAWTLVFLASLGNDTRRPNHSLTCTSRLFLGTVTQSLCSNADSLLPWQRPRNSRLVRQYQKAVGLQNSNRDRLIEMFRGTAWQRWCQTTRKSKCFTLKTSCYHRLDVRPPPDFWKLKLGELATRSSAWTNSSNWRRMLSL